MDFSYLLELAQSNDKTNKKEASTKRFTTKLTGPKKDDKFSCSSDTVRQNLEEKASKKKFSTNLSGPKKVEKSAVNTDAIKRRLDEKEEKKKIELKAFNAKKEKLLELRSHDKKANKRVNAMINMSKGACKSVLDEVKNLSTDKAEPQCDADDYGYESAMSQQIFAKLADTYKEIPDDERLKFKKTGAKSMQDIKNRVMHSLKRQEEEEMIPGRRKRKTKRKVDQDDFLNDGDPYDNIGPQTASVGSKEVIKERERNEKLGITSPSKKQKHKMPVNVNLTFTKSVKSSAFKYQDKPRDKSKDREKKQERDKDRNRDRDRDRDREKKRDREDSVKPIDDDKPKSFKIPKKKKPDSENLNKMPPPMSFQELLKIANEKKGKALADPKAKILEVKEKKKEEKKKRDSERPMTGEEKEAYEDEQNRRNKKMGIKEDSGRLRDALEKKSDSKSQSKNESKNEQKAKSKQPEPKPEPPPPPPKPDRSKYFATPASKKTQPPSELPKKNKDKDKDRPRDLPPKVSSKEPPRKSSKDSSSRDSSSKDSSKSRDTSRLFPPSDVRRKPTSITNGRNRIESDEDSEYDSEMDDFIDDGAEEMDYRSEIAKMFKIDRDKWRRIDAEDVDDMEVGYSQLEKEESRSAQIGLMEDMEDMKSEERYRKQKLARKKMAGKSR